MTAFAILPASVFTDTSLSPAEFRVLGALFSFRSGADDWHVWPSRHKIAERAGIKAIDHISHITKRLEDAGWIKRERRRGSSIYHLFNTRWGRHEDRDSGQDMSTPPQIDQTQGDQTQNNLPSPSTGDTQQRQAQPGVMQKRVERSIRKQEKKDKTCPSEAVRSVLSLFSEVCGVTYPMTGAIAQKVSQALSEHGVHKLTKVIKAKGAAFRYPLALLKPEIVESVAAELKRSQTPEQPTASTKEKRLYGIPVSVIEKNARPGETLEDAALRLYEAKRAA